MSVPPSSPQKEAPWLFRTYAGHSTAKASNALYRTNLAKGQTGLSVAFDLPTQTGYDSDHELARGEVGKVGVPVAHLGDMRALFDAIPLEQMNTSMTINATAAWLLALYVANAREHGVSSQEIRGTTQNDIVKGLLERTGQAALPVTLVQGQLALAGRYPSRDDLARWAGVAPTSTVKPAEAPAAASCAPADASCCSGGRCC